MQATSFIFPVLSALGALTTQAFSVSNGFIDVLEETAKHGYFPGTSHRMARLTGLAPIDDFLCMMTVFYFGVADGTHPAASLQVFRFAGQLVAMWTFVVMESERPANAGRWISR